jgi:hypothetical protein
VTTPGRVGFLPEETDETEQATLHAGGRQPDCGRTPAARRDRPVSSRAPNRVRVAHSVGRGGKAARLAAENAGALLERTAHGPVESVAAEGDPFEAIKRTLDKGDFDDVIISTLPETRL